jgi:hypothetical protein
MVFRVAVRVSSAFVLLIVLGACGSSSSKGDGGGTGDDSVSRRGDSGTSTDGTAGTDTGGAPASAGLACQMLVVAEEERNQRCQGGVLADWQAYQSTSTDCDAYDRHVAEGLVEYHPELLAACLQKFQASCDDPAPYPCQYQVLLGKVADGQPCTDFEVCGPVSACLNLGSDACGDVCARLGNENETCGIYCGPGAPCLEGDLCTSGLFCLSGTCVQQKQLGDACGGATQIACADQLACKLTDPTDPESAGTCVHRVAGGPCTDDSACPLTQFCLAGTCTAHRAAGGSCADSSTACQPWTVCDDPGTQKCVAAGRIGEPCSSTSGCIMGVCDGQTCQPVSLLGGSCAAAGCVQGTFCDSASQTCLACSDRGGGTDAGTGGGTDTGTGGGKDTGTDTGTGGGIDAGMDTGTGGGKDTGTDTGTGGGTDTGSGGGIDAGTDTGTGGGTDTGSPPDDGGTGGACTDLTNLATPVNETMGVGTAPSPGGGQLTNGTYVLTRWDLYPPSTATPSVQHQITFRIAGTHLDIALTNQDGSTLNATATFTTVGTNGTLTYTCGATGTFLEGYSATTSTLQLFSGTGTVQTYTLKP